MASGTRNARRAGLITALIALFPGAGLAEYNRVYPGDAPTADLTRTVQVSSFKDANALYTSGNDRAYLDAAKAELQRRHVEQASVVAEQARESQQARKLSAAQGLFEAYEKLKKNFKDPQAWGEAVSAQRDDFKNSLEKQKQRFDAEIAETRQQLNQYENNPEFSQHLASAKRDARLPDDHPEKGRIYTSTEVEQIQVARGHAQARLNQLQAEKAGYERAGNYIENVERLQNAMDKYGELAQKREEFLNSRSSGAAGSEGSSPTDLQGALEDFKELSSGYGRAVVDEVLTHAGNLKDFAATGVDAAADESQKTFQRLLGQHRDDPGEYARFGELKDGQLTGALKNFKEQRELQTFLDGVDQTIDTVSGGLDKIDQVNGYIERVERYTGVMTDRTERERIGNLEYVPEDMKSGVQKFSDVNRALKALSDELPEGLPRESARLVTRVGDTLIEAVDAGNKLQQIKAQGGEDMFGDMKLIDRQFAEESGLVVREIMDGDDAGKFVVKDDDGTEIVVTHDQLIEAKDVMSAMTMTNGRNLTQTEFVEVAAAVKYGAPVEINVNSVGEGVVDLGTKRVSVRDLLGDTGRALLEEDRLNVNRVDAFMQQAFDGTSILDEEKGEVSAIWSQLWGGDARQFRDWKDLPVDRREDLINKMNALNAIVREADRGELTPNQFGSLVRGDIEAGGGLLNDIELARLKLGDPALDDSERGRLRTELAANLAKLGIRLEPKADRQTAREKETQSTESAVDARTDPEPAIADELQADIAEELVNQQADLSADPDAARRRAAEELAGRLMAAGATADQTRAAIEAWMAGDMATLQSINRQVTNPVISNPELAEAAAASPSQANPQDPMSAQLAERLRAAGASPAQVQAAIAALRDGDVAALQQVNQQVLESRERKQVAEQQEPDEPAMSDKERKKMNKSIARMRKNGATEQEIHQVMAAYRRGDQGYARSIEYQVAQRDLQQFMGRLNQVSESFNSTMQQLTAIKQARQEAKQGAAPSSSGSVSSQGASGSGATVSAGGTAQYSGAYSGSWGGSCSIYGGVNGSFSVSISAGGSVSGSFSGFESGSIGGSVSPSGQFRATGSASGGGMNCNWVGTVRRAGAGVNGSGQWSCGSGCGGGWSL